MTYLLPVRTGWAPAPGQDDLYPEDLPEEWRIAYFANEVLGVLVPPATWHRALGDELDVWREDAAERFRFYLEVPPGGTAAARAAAEALGDRFGGLVGQADDIAADWLGDDQRWVIVEDDASSVPSEKLAAGIAVCCPQGLIRDLKGARRWIESLVGSVGGPSGESPRRAILCLLGECNLDDLRRWQGLVELMGLSF